MSDKKNFINGQHWTDVNRQTSLMFVKKSAEFLNLPMSLFQCDIEKRNPSLYNDKEGKRAIVRSKKAVILAKKAIKVLSKLEKLLK